eukprot:6462764-Amphidinium_carterae.1
MLISLVTESSATCCTSCVRLRSSKYSALRCSFEDDLAQLCTCSSPSAQSHNRLRLVPLTVRLLLATAMVTASVWAGKPVTAGLVDVPDLAPGNAPLSLCPSNLQPSHTHTL